MIGLVLAAHRAARAVSIDTITAKFRKKVQDWSIDVKATSAQVRRRQYVHDLVKCPYCTGFWLSGITVFAAMLARRRGWRWLRPLMLWWTVAGAQSFITGVHHWVDMQGDLVEEQVKQLKSRNTTS